MSGRPNHRPPSLDNLKRKVELFNRMHPVGTDVTLRKNDGSIITTKTRSLAAVVGEYNPVVWLECDAAAWHIDRVAKIHPAVPTDAGGAS